MKDWFEDNHIEDVARAIREQAGQALPDTALQAAVDYFERGWVPLPIALGEKGPTMKDWPGWRPTKEDLRRHFDGTPQNIGVLLGEPSGGLVDVDLDCLEAVRVAKEFLPETRMFGRASKPDSHWLYVARGAATSQFRDPVDKTMLLELRSTGAQTVFPPSVHPSGEPIAFTNDIGPLEIGADDLLRRVQHLAAVALLMRHGITVASACELAHEWEPGSDDGLPEPVQARVREWLGLRPPPASSSSPSSPPRGAVLDDIDSRIRRARAYIAKMPPAISGQGGHDALWAVALVMVRGFDLPEAKAFGIINEDYNPRCQPPWSDREVRHKVADAIRARTPEGFLLDDDVLSPAARDARMAVARAASGADAPAGATPIRTAAEILDGLSARPPQRTYATGFAGLDDLIAGGVKSRQLTVLCGPTGSGKTGLAGELALRLSDEGPVLFVSTEIDPDEQAARLAAQAWRASRQPDGSPTATLVDTVAPTTADVILAGGAPAEALRAVDRRPIYVHFLDPDDADPIGAIRLRVAEVQVATGRPPTIIVDYLQQLVADDPEGKRLGVSSVANMLRRIAQNLDVPVVAVSSVSRAFYGQNRRALDGEEDPRAWLAAAKESGDVEYASAVLAYLDTAPAVDATGETPARLIVAKSRRGRVGFVGLRFHGPTGHFRQDDAAVDMLGPGARSAEDERRVLEVVRGVPGGLMSSEVRQRVRGCAKTRIDDAISRLLGRGELVERMAARGGGRGRARMVLVATQREAGHE